MDRPGDCLSPTARRNHLSARGHRFFADDGVGSLGRHGGEVRVRDRLARDFGGVGGGPGRSQLARVSPKGNPPALLEDSQSLTAPGVDRVSKFVSRSKSTKGRLKCATPRAWSTQARNSNCIGAFNLESRRSEGRG